MAVAQGYGKTVTSGSVFAYDTGDTINSYIGEPTTNLALFTIASSTFSTDTPSNLTQTANSTEATYQGRLSRKMVIGSGFWNCYIYNYNTSNSSTDYTISFKVKAADGSHPNTFIGGGYIYGSAGNFVLSTSFTPVDNGWYLVYIKYSGSAMTLNSLTGVYGSGGPKTFYIADYQAEAKNHPTPFTSANTTRSSTQGLLPLVGNSTLNLSNVSFDSNAKLYFDGTNDYFTLPYSSNLDTPNGCTYELMIYPTGAGEVINRGTNDGNDNPRIYIYANGAVYFDWSSGGTDRNVTSSTNLTMNTWNHLVCTATPGSALKIYINSLQVASGTTQPTPLPNTSNDIEVGRASWLPRYGSAKIDVLKIYNRALSAGEVRQNYLHYKTRFNLS